MLAQLGSLSHAPPGLETPPHMVLRKRKDYEVRRHATAAVRSARAAGLEPRGLQLLPRSWAACSVFTCCPAPTYRNA